MSSTSNADLALKALARSERWLQGAERALEDERWDDVVFASQMAVETSSKAVLLAMGVDFPKAHDVSAVFREVAGSKLASGWFPTEKLASNISVFAAMRGLAEYAYEMGEGPERFKKDAPVLKKDADQHVEQCRKLLNELFGGPSGELKRGAGPRRDEAS